MNPLHDPLGCDPLEQVGRAVELPPLDTPIPLDPLDAMLDRLEDSMEQPPMPGLDVFADPLARALDQVESSLEYQRFDDLGLDADPLHSVLDRIEAETEHAAGRSGPGCWGPDPDGPDPGSGALVAMEGDSPPGMACSELGMGIAGGSDPDYVYRSHGTRAGVRRQSNIVYCTVRCECVDTEACRECADFEPADECAGDDEEYCLYASDYQDRKERHT